MEKLSFLCIDIAAVLLVCVSPSAQDCSFSFVFPLWDYLKSYIWRTHTQKQAGETAHIFLFGKFLVGFLQCNCGQPCAGQLGCSSLHEEPVASFPSSVTDFSHSRKERIEFDFGCSYSGRGAME